MPRVNISVIAAGLAGSALFAAPAATQSAAGGPVARYTMDAGTMSGMAGMAGGAADVMAMFGGGGAVAHELILRLGSSRAPSGSPEADHFLPRGMDMGASVPLVTPAGRPTPDTAGYQMPQARLLLFWGCGERAGPGQPVVIDVSRLARGETPPNLFSPAVDVPDQWRVLSSNSRTYGDWPNHRDGKTVPARASLMGAHKVTSSYAPEIGFDLDTDFMAPVALQSSQLDSGAFALRWNAVPGATGYYAWAMSAREGMGADGQATEMVWWTSSATQAFGGPMWDWMSPAAAARLVAAKTVMPPSQQDCTIPAEVREAGGEMTMANLAAYGPQRDFSYPPRPADARAGWSPEWIARVRFRSTAMVMLGMDMEGMAMGQTEDGPAADNAAPAPVKKPKCRGLAGIAKRAAGLCE